jgi:hypothetical protein
MKYYFIALLFTSIIFASCEKEVIVIIEEEEILIDSIDMEQYTIKYLDGFNLYSTRELYNNGTMEYRYNNEVDSVNLLFRVSPFGTYKEAKTWLINDIQSYSTVFYPGTEDMEPLGNEFWWSRYGYQINGVAFRRHNASFVVYTSKCFNIMPFAQMLDQAIIDKEDFVYFRESQE